MLRPARAVYTTVSFWIGRYLDTDLYHPATNRCSGGRRCCCNRHIFCRQFVLFPLFEALKLALYVRTFSGPKQLGVCVGYNLEHYYNGQALF